jgi:hypothetical protein
MPHDNEGKLQSFFWIYVKVHHIQVRTDYASENCSDMRMVTLQMAEYAKEH